MTVTTIVVTVVHKWVLIDFIVGVNEIAPNEQWARMPKPKERLSGLSRTTLLELSEEGLIRTVAIRKPGAVKGIRLVFMPSLFAYLESLKSTRGGGVEVKSEEPTKVAKKLKQKR